MFRQASDDPFKLRFFLIVFLIGDEDRAAKGQAAGKLACPPKADFDRLLRLVEHRKLDDFGNQERDRDGDVLGRVHAVEFEVDAQPSCRIRRARAKLGRKLRE